MSAHNGVSCDSCMRANFPGRRYKCLLCDNYDLCGVCYDIEAESQNHKNDHPMQCILTEAAHEIFYAGETIPRRTAVSLTCSHCGLAGFIPRTLLMHCVEKHSSTSTTNKNNQVVMCPICVTSPTHHSRSRFVCLAEHIATAHDEESGGPRDNWGTSSSTTPIRRERNEEENSDEDEDEDDEPSLHDLEHRAFIEEEHRRQETARQRLAHHHSLAAVIRNDYAAAAAAASSGSTNSQRRPFIRQTAIRGARGSLRGHFTNYPYGTAPRLATGFASSAALRAASDASTGNSNQNPSLSDPYAAFAIAQDPMLEFVSRLVNNQQGSSTTSNNPMSSPFLFGLSNTGQTSASSSTTTTPTELTRLQQIENNETMAQIKSTLLNNKQKRPSQNQQSSEQPVVLSHPWGLDYSALQQPFANFHSSTNIFGGSLFNDPTIGNNSLNTNSSSKHSQQSYREHDPRSLLGKIIRDDHGVNNDSKNELRQTQEQDHLAYLQSILLSTILTTSDEEQQQQQQQHANHS